MDKGLEPRQDIDILIDSSFILHLSWIVIEFVNDAITLKSDQDFKYLRLVGYTCM